MRILLLTDDVRDTSRPDVLDALDQSRTVREALVRLGHEVQEGAVSSNWDDLRRLLDHARPDLVFNLVESFLGHGRLIALVPEFLEAMGIPYTGSPASVLRFTSDKLAVKRLLVERGLPTPAHVEHGVRTTGFAPSTYIVKSVWEHASLGIDDDSVFFAAEPTLVEAAMEQRRGGLGGEAFAERYVPGREFNLSLLAGRFGPRVLPPAEIRFVGFTNGKPRIVGYRAKWDPTSFEYHRTPRSFDFEGSDRPLLARLSDLARQVWRVCSLRGFARVDFRVDDDGEPWILEVNANPCLADDAGFQAAVHQAGFSFDQAIEAILDDVAHR
ncbi:MAG: D-alanine--D-alanine ligase [Planctomycetes bacterium]|nr:D-alanine--D-alanine ligase [Planctomycetota bacterium]